MLAVSENVRAGDGSGTKTSSGIGGLLGVPISGFHFDSGTFSALSSGVDWRSSGIDVKQDVSGGLIGIGSFLEGSKTSGVNGISEESIEFSFSLAISSWMLLMK